MKKLSEIIRNFNYREHKFLKITILVSFLINFLFIVILESNNNFSGIKSQYQAGTIAQKDIVADFPFQYIDSKAMSRLKYEAEKKTVPVYKVDNSISSEVLENFNEFSTIMQDFISGNVNYDNYYTLSDKMKGLGYNFNPDFLVSMGKSPAALSVLEQIRIILEDAMNAGIIGNNSLSYDKNGTIEVWRWYDSVREKEDVDIGDILTADKLASYIRSTYGKSLADEDLSSVIFFVSEFAEENLFFDYDETEAKKNAILDNIEPVYKSVSAGDIIVKKGFLISESDIEKIRMLRNSTGMNIENLFGTFLFLLLIYLFSIIILSMIMTSLARKQSFIFLFMIFAQIQFVLMLVFLKIPPYISTMNAALLLPTAAFSMLLSIVCNVMTGTFFSTVSALLLLMLDVNSILPPLFVVLSGVTGSLVVYKFNKRIDLIKSGLFLSIMNFIFVLVFNLLLPHTWKNSLFQCIFAFINGFASSILCLGILPILEQIMNVPTLSRLAELSDLNTPILQKMLHMASGTFNHSILVGNLAETACNDINANGLLARVGGYYHDIGKIDQSDFFIENQESYNRHDSLSPSLSVSIIKSHVKYGVEKAKELNLPQEVIDIIAHHHGNGLISYFYMEAMKLEDRAKVTPAAYSYNDGKPKSKEEAVVLLADNVEAAVRALKTPTVDDIEKRVDSIIKSKIESEQLSDSDLTFRDLQIIRDSFINTLKGIHHSRIQYPKQEEINELSADSD